MTLALFSPQFTVFNANYNIPRPLQLEYENICASDQNTSFSFIQSNEHAETFLHISPVDFLFISFLFSTSFSLFSIFLTLPRSFSLCICDNERKAN